MRNNIIYKCVECNGKLDAQMFCCQCGKHYFSDKKGVISMVSSITSEKRQVIHLYDTLAVEKKKNSYARFSTYLNYGVLNVGQSYKGTQNNSMNLIKDICNKVDFNKKRIIDIGCGRGGNLFYINSRFNASYMVGIDLSYENIVFCNSKDAKINFIQADAENLPFFKEMFDIVVNVESALHYPNIEKFFGEVERVLRNKGIFIYVDIIEDNVYEKRKKSLLSRNFCLVYEHDYTEDVLRAMKARKLDELDNTTTLFSHSEMYKELCEHRKKYTIWIMEKKD